MKALSTMSASGHEPDRHMTRRGLLTSSAGLAAAAILAGCTTPALAPPSAPEPTRRPATGGSNFVAADGHLWQPDGTEFVAIGANLGTTGSFDWKGSAKGHAADALDWGWNTVRLNLMVTGSYSWSYVAQNSLDALLELTSALVSEYTKAGIVVVLDAHDNPLAKGLDRAKVESGMVTWWKEAAAAFKDNPRVWSGLMNEPAYANDDWVAVLDKLSSAVRGTGNASPILVGAPCWGQDVGHTKPYFADVRYAHEPTMAPMLNQRHGNVVLEQHNYGAYGRYSTIEKFTAYIGAVRAAGLTPLVGEFGYTVEKGQSPDVYEFNREAAASVFEAVRALQVGALWWHASHGDNYSLKADGSAFWNGGNSAGLSEGGRQLWDFTHGSR